jgi:hypothetical protein
MRRIAAAALIIVGFLAFRGHPTAQALGAMTGVVKDKSGAVLPGVTVRVASVELIERVRTTVTNGSGQYRVVNLPAGVYTVTFSLVGFSPVVQLGIEVSAGLTAAVDAEMSVAAQGFTGAVPGLRPFFSLPPAAVTQPYVRCGLTIVPGDPRIDPKIRVPFDKAQSRLSGGSRTEHSMRTIAPQICR